MSLDNGVAGLIAQQFNLDPEDADRIVQICTGPSEVTKLKRDMRLAAAGMTTDEARFQVDAYYAMQRDRLRAANQQRALSNSGEPCEMMSWLAQNRFVLEKEVGKALSVYASSTVPGRWVQSHIGLGSIIAAGLLANIDIEKAPTVGHIWRFAGQDPTVQWLPNQRRPWNASLKRLCFMIGSCMVWVSNREKDVYGKVYKARKIQEVERNLEGRFAEQAAETLRAKNFSKDTTAKSWYEKGMLPPARIQLRAQRYAVKLFLSHFHCVLFFDRYGKLPPKPYILTRPDGAHADFLGPPNAHLVTGLREALSSDPLHRELRAA